MTAGGREHVVMRSLTARIIATDARTARRGRGRGMRRVRAGRGNEARSCDRALSAVGAAGRIVPLRVHGSTSGEGEIVAASRMCATSDLLLAIFDIAVRRSLLCTASLRSSSGRSMEGIVAILVVESVAHGP